MWLVAAALGSAAAVATVDAANGTHKLPPPPPPVRFGFPDGWPAPATYALAVPFYNSDEISVGGIVIVDPTMPMQAKLDWGSLTTTQASPTWPEWVQVDVSTAAFLSVQIRVPDWARGRLTRAHGSDVEVGPGGFCNVTCEACDDCAFRVYLNQTTSGGSGLAPRPR